MSQIQVKGVGGAGAISSVSATDIITNNDNGLYATTIAGAATVYLSNRGTNGISTTDDTPTTAFTFTPADGTGTYYVWGDVVAFNVDDTTGAAFSFSGAYLYETGGPTLTEIGVEIGDTFKQASMAAVDFAVNASGTDVVVTVTGLAGKDINWSVFFNFRFVGT